jgi:hypothetical protein
MRSSCEMWVGAGGVGSGIAKASSMCVALEGIQVDSEGRGGRARLRSTRA